MTTPAGQSLFTTNPEEADYSADSRTKASHYFVRSTTGAGQTKHVIENEVGQKLGFSSEEIKNASRYLKDEGLIKWISQQGAIAITHEGIKEVEQALSEPKKPTTYFPPVMNIIHVGHMEGSQIQQATSESSQTYMVSENDQQQLAEFIALLREKLPGLDLDSSDRDELQADVATLEAQVASGRPKTGIIKESLGSVRRILEGAAGAVAAAELHKYLALLPFQ